MKRKPIPSNQSVSVSGSDSFNTEQQYAEQNAKHLGYERLKPSQMEALKSLKKQYQQLHASSIQLHHHQASSQSSHAKSQQMPSHLVKIQRLLQSEISLKKTICGLQEQIASTVHSEEGVRLLRKKEQEQQQVILRLKKQQEKHRASVVAFIDDIAKLEARIAVQELENSKLQDQIKGEREKYCTVINENNILKKEIKRLENEIGQNKQSKHQQQFTLKEKLFKMEIQLNKSKYKEEIQNMKRQQSIMEKQIQSLKENNKITKQQNLERERQYQCFFKEQHKISKNQINKIINTSQKLQHINNKYKEQILIKNNQCQELKRQLKKVLQYNTTVDHLWQVKKIQIIQLKQILQYLKQ